MPALLSCRAVSFTYRGRQVPALTEVDLDLEEGELAGVAGQTGAGKSTLVRAACGVVPKLLPGAFAGELRLRGRPIGGRRVSDLAGQVGAVFQDFEAQLFCTSVRRELAFGMENLGVPRAEMSGRLRDAAGQVGIEGLLEREPHGLSGGQKQRLAIGCTLALRPDLLLADEPTTDLDPVGKGEVTAVLVALARQGHSIALVEHEAERLLGAHRVHLLSQGRLVAGGPPAQVFADPEACRRHGLFPPPLYDLFARLGLPARPASVEEADGLLRAGRFEPRPDWHPAEPPATAGEPLLAAEGLRYAYAPDLPALQGVSLEVRRGEVVALLGRNGSGKTTLAKVLAGLLPASAGQVWLAGEPVATLGPAHRSRRVGFAFQNPDHMLFAADAASEVAFGLEHTGVPAGDIPERVRQALEAVGLAGRQAEDPFAMARGDRQKLAVACVLAGRPELLVLDEPTTGLDAGEQLAMVELIRGHQRRGGTAVVITHGLEIAAACAQRAVVLDQGRLLADGPLRQVFAQPDLLERAGLVAPACARLAHRWGIPALSAEELASALVRRGP